MLYGIDVITSIDVIAAIIMILIAIGLICYIVYNKLEDNPVTIDKVWIISLAVSLCLTVMLPSKKTMLVMIYTQMKSSTK